MRDLEDMGDCFVSALARLKHNGASGRCIEGFVSVAERSVNVLLQHLHAHLLLSGHKISCQKNAQGMQGSLRYDGSLTTQHHLIK